MGKTERYTEEELKSAQSMTDLEKIDSLADEEITKAALEDPDGGILTDAEWKGTRPASEVLPKIFPKQVADNLLRQRGRPRKEVTKQAVSIRLSPEVIETFRASGSGWQTRIDDALKDWLKTHRKA